MKTSNLRNVICLFSILLLFSSCNSDKDITSFSIGNYSATIEAATNNVLLLLPMGTDLTNLTPTISITGQSVSPASGVPQNFTIPVPYTVKAIDGSTKMYKVIVRPDPNIILIQPETFTVCNTVNFNMIHVPGGLTFPTGMNDSSTATVPNAYWIAETEATYELYECIRNQQSDYGYSIGDPGLMGSNGTTANMNPQHPVTAVNWFSAVVFTNLLSEVLGLNPVYRCGTNIIKDNSTASNCNGFNITPDPLSNGFRLPTNNEWELAARWKGGNSSYGAIEVPAGSGKYWTRGNYASGANEHVWDNVSYQANLNQAPTQTVTWYNANSGGSTKEVKLKNPNALGLYDMSGNVSEWCFDTSSGGLQTNLLVRGGGYWDPAHFMSIGYKYFYTTPGNAVDTSIGFRLSRAVPANPNQAQTQI